MVNWQEFISMKIPLVGELEVTILTLIVILGIILLLKGTAMWKASHKNHRFWFWTLLILNTAGILPILYLTVFSKK